MREMGMDAIYPRMNLSKRQQHAQVMPYLLKNAVITRPNQAWSVDITYIPTKHGFLYLTAVIDWHSRCIVGWEVDDTLDTRMVVAALNKAFKTAQPDIINSDQGCQFTSQQYIDFVKENGIRQSMDGKSRWADNIMIERWFRSFKYEEAYLTQYNNIKEASQVPLVNISDKGELVLNGEEIVFEDYRRHHADVRAPIAARRGADQAPHRPRGPLAVCGRLSRALRRPHARGARRPAQ